MSISVKSLSVSIDGVRSNEFDIELDGITYHLDSFSLHQSLLAPNSLSFTMHKGPEEDIRDAQFSVCSNIIGKEITLSLETEIISLANDDDKADEIVFKGIILSAYGSRSRTEYYIQVSAESWEALLKDSPACRSYEHMTLDDIVNNVQEDYSDQIGALIDCRMKEDIPYCVQYNENNYAFLQRLARRYGEWMYNDGKSFVFGNLAEKDEVVLKYPSQDIPSYNVDLQMQHVAFSHLSPSYNSNDYTVKEGAEEMEREYNDLSEFVYQASKERYSKPTLQNLGSGGFADQDGRDFILNASTKTRGRGIKAGMMTYTGTTYCSKLKIGGKLIITDNFINNPMTDEKSDVEQDEILITELSHHFTKGKIYSNHFSGIPASCDYPPYADTDVFAHAEPCRARVTDTEDPNSLGRVRVQFDWQKELDSEMMTPWLRISQPYSGGQKGVSFIPEIGEEVIIGFEGGNADRPYVMGALFNGVDSPDNAWLPGNNQVKAIRTRNGHTVEIWDAGEGGYIRIYDHGKENYILTFSTDEKLIKLESTGNIELYAKNDIIMHAGHDINASADNDIFIAASHDMQRTAENDIREYAGNDRSTTIDRNDSLNVTQNQFVKVGENKDDQIGHKLQVSAENIREEASDKMLLYSSVHQQKASDSMAMNAGSKIDIKAGTVKVN